MGHIRTPCGLYPHPLPTHTSFLMLSWRNVVVTMGDRYDDSLASNIKALQPFLLFPRGQISTPPAEIHEVAHLHVSIQGGSLQVSEEKKVLVKAPELGTFVQTDKNVYKPGQTGEGQEVLEELMGSWNGTSGFRSQALALTPAPAFALSSEVSNCPFGSKLHS